jgi:hypothetical protein
VKYSRICEVLYENTGIPCSRFRKCVQGGTGPLAPALTQKTGRLQGSSSRCHFADTDATNDATAPATVKVTVANPLDAAAVNLTVQEADPRSHGAWAPAHDPVPCSLRIPWMIPPPRRDNAV